MRTLAAVVVLAVAHLGCIERMILDGTIRGTRQAGRSFDEIPDYEVARSAAAAGIAQFEGFHALAPDNEDALFLLLSGWTGYASAFIEDEWEQAAESGDDEREQQIRERARKAYDRAIHFGSKLLERRKKGFEDAQRNYDTMKAYLAGFSPEHAEELLWMGLAWLSRGNVGMEDPEIVANLFVGVALLERSVELDDRLLFGLGSAVLGSYHARSPDAELKLATERFERALAISERKSLTIQVLYAASYACNAKDRKLYESLLSEVLEANDPLPAQRLANLIARRKAARYLSKSRLQRCGWE